jgi:hypothetical protein
MPPFGPAVFGATSDQLASFNYWRSDFNTWLRETYTLRGQLVDVASVLGDVLAPAHNAGDGVHLTATAQNAVAAYVGPQVISLTL